MPEAVDIHVGKRLRQRRRQIGITQKALAQKTGVKFQQVQKYETGANRVSASRLWDIADVLDVPVSYFFDELNPGAGKESWAGPDADQLASRETCDLVASWYSMPATQRAILLALAKDMARKAREQDG